MSVTKKSVFLLLLLLLVFCIPNVAFAGYDDYGLNKEGRIFIGTMDNWEAYLRSLPPVAVDPNCTDTMFVERKWDKLFDPMMVNHCLPLGPGAWQKVKIWQSLTGEQQGWTYHLELEVIYSPNTPIKGAIEIPTEAMGGFSDFYCVEQIEWLTGPHGEKTVSQDLTLKQKAIQQALKF
ncbi:MAG: hypothetical protein AWM53_01555 [Candidatus Dichloromethanomonas elyunquensis]|nr:MAG: hypothetical protein AWM53_01555 [Candidatus Dichloromethanomonas elyunquensis]